MRSLLQFNELKNAVKMRHYSPKTLKTYSGWVRKLQTYTKSKDPRLVSVDDVKAFLTWLAVDQNVSASSQNQAFNALLFLFRNVFGKEFGLENQCKSICNFSISLGNSHWIPAFAGMTEYGSITVCIYPSELSYQGYVPP